MIDRPTPHVTVVIPAYNQAGFLAQAVDSVLAQTYRDYELIVVDDGSTDDTAQVAQAYGSRLSYTYQENQGLAGARNTGLRLARGKLVAFLDSDDAWLPGFLDTIEALTRQAPEASAYYCGWRYMDTEGRDLPQAGTQVVAPEHMYEALLKSNFLNACTVAARRSALLQAGLFDPAFRRIQDWDMWLRLLKAGHRFVGSGSVQVRYRLHGQSLSTDPRSGKRAIVAVIEKLFGPDDGQQAGWPQDKRWGYGGAYRHCALTALVREQDWKGCAAFVARALQANPELAHDVALFYELALGTQPLGYRGTAHNLDVNGNAGEVETLLKAVLDMPPLRENGALQRQVRGTAYYALGLVAYNVDRSTASRGFLVKAVRYRPQLMQQSEVAYLLGKSLLGKAGVARVRRLSTTLPRLPVRSQ